MRKVLYVFGLLTDVDVNWLARTGIRRRLAPNDVLIKQGDHIDFIAILLEGQMHVRFHHSKETTKLGVGEMVGEMSLVDSGSASATISAAEPSVVLCIEKRTLIEKIGADDGFGSRFYHALAVFLADRLRAANQRLSANGAALDSDAPHGELDLEVLDHVFEAGERFSRMIKQFKGLPPP